MRIEERKTITEKFSTFLKFREVGVDYIPFWQTDTKLSKQMRDLLASDPQASEQYFVQLFLKQIFRNAPDKLAGQHILAYLEETCYLTAEAMTRKVTKSGSTRLDYFQIARARIAEPKKVFAKFNPQLSSIKTYAQLKIKTHISEMVRVGKEREKYQDAGLLRSLSKKSLQECLSKDGILPLNLQSLPETELEQILTQCGISQEQITRAILAFRCFKEVYQPRQPAKKIEDQLPKGTKPLQAIANCYGQIAEPITKEQLEPLLQLCVDGVRQQCLQEKCLLAWRCFKQVYVPKKAAGSQRLAWPNKEQLQTIAERYNQLIKISPTTITGEEIDALLKTCLQAVRSASTPTISYLEDEPDWSDEEYEPEDGEEFIQKAKQINSLLEQAFHSLTENDQKMLQLHGLSIKQSDLGLVFQLKQYQVARQLSKLKQTLLQALEKESQENLEVPLNIEQLTPKQLQVMAGQIDLWLQRYSQKPYLALFEQIILQELLPELPFLQTYSAYKGELKKVAQEMKITQSQAQQRLASIQQHLQSKLAAAVRTNLTEPTNLQSADKCFQKLTANWLKTAPYAVIATKVNPFRE